MWLIYVSVLVYEHMESPLYFMQKRKALKGILMDLKFV